MAVWFAYRDGRPGEGREVLLAPSDRFDVLLDALRPCLRRAWVPCVAAERMHVFAEMLVPKGAVQLGLFDPPGARAEAVTTLKRAVNGRHGRFALRSGAALPLVEVYRDPANRFDICDVRVR